MQALEKIAKDAEAIDAYQIAEYLHDCIELMERIRLSRWPEAAPVSNVDEEDQQPYT